MSKDKTNYKKELNLLFDELDDSISDLSEQEIDNALEDQGMKPDNVVHKMRQVCKESIATFRKSKLDVAQEKRIAIETQTKSILANIASYTREKLIDELSLIPEAQYALREQNLQMESMEDDDLRALLEDLMLTQAIKKNE